MRFSFLLAMFFSISAFAGPPEIVTAPKGVKKIQKEVWRSNQSKTEGFWKESVEESTFDKDGRLFSIHTEGDGWCEKVHETFFYKFDDRGRPLEVKKKINLNWDKIWKYEYGWDGSFTIEIFSCDTDGEPVVNSNKIEVWKFNENGLPVSFQEDNGEPGSWEETHSSRSYQYADWHPYPGEKPTYGHGRLLRIIEDIYSGTAENRKNHLHYENFQIYTKDNRLELIYWYDTQGAMYAKVEFDEREEEKLTTVFYNEIEGGAIKTQAPANLFTTEHKYCSLHGIELKDETVTATYLFSYPNKEGSLFQVDLLADGKETITLARKTVYRYEFYEDLLKKEEKAK
ncbi:MAG: hypothetical protein G01um101419_355 [Parcubacteria group bacterium Gr01-1014_19]|nr:MAG: hypothetical protein G01um101419_355 [Parcubacteria group bacterium Gr01-1014_19]